MKVDTACKACYSVYLEVKSARGTGLVSVVRLLSKGGTERVVLWRKMFCGLIVYFGALFPRRPKRPCPLVVPAMTALFLDENLPDGTRLRPGTKFIKYWKMRNTGSVSWSSETKVLLWDEDAPGICTLSEVTIDSHSTLSRKEDTMMRVRHNIDSLFLSTLISFSAEVHVGESGCGVGRPLA